MRTILFKQELERARGTVDYSTENSSFVRMAALLKKMGINNHSFMLFISQPELIGVDPHDPGLDEETILKITYECKVNPWYFFREVIRVPTSGSDAVRYILNRANLALIWLFFNETHIFLTMPRQIGKTVGTLGLILYMQYIKGKNSNIGLFAKGNSLRQENVDRLKQLRDALPGYLYQAGIKYNTDNAEGLTYKPLNNKYQTFVALGNKRNAAAQGKGETQIFQQWDEVSSYTNIDLSYPSALSAASAGWDNAKAAGISCANILTTTAGNIASPEGKYAYGIKNSCLPFSETMYDCESNKELKEIIAVGGCTNNMVYCEFSYKQLGKTEAWFAEKTAMLDKMTVRTDYLNEWTHGDGNSLFSATELDKLTAGIREPSCTTIEDALVLRWYVERAVIDSPKFQEKALVLSSDTSANVGRDYTTLLLMDPADMSVVMTCRCNQANLMYVARCVVRLLTKFKRTVFIPERNANGIVMIDNLLASFEADTTFNAFTRIYNTYVQDWQAGDKSFNSYDLGNGSVRKKFGFNTTASANSRHALYSSILTTVVEKNHDKMYDATLVDEIRTLVTRNGRVDHSEEGHDDLLIAYLIASWFVMRGRNMQKYGIRPDEILTHTEANDEGTIAKRELIERLNYIDSRLDDKKLSPMLRTTLTRERNDLVPLIGDVSTSLDVISTHQVEQDKRSKKKHATNIQVLQSTFNLFNSH